VGATSDALEEAGKNSVPIFSTNVIYTLLENYSKWVESEKEKEKILFAKSIIRPAKLFVLPKHCFRVSKPAIFGVEVLGGTLRPGYVLMNSSGEELGEIKNIQLERKSIEEAPSGAKVAISVEGVFLGKNVKEKDTLFSSISKKGAKELRERYYSYLSDEEKSILEEIERIMGASL
jgi:translation initiation factor 5B